jgi:hypothetical protein
MSDKLQFVVIVVTLKHCLESGYCPTKRAIARF